MPKRAWKVVVYRQWYRWCWSEKCYLAAIRLSPEMQCKWQSYLCHQHLMCQEVPHKEKVQLTLIRFCCWLQGFSPASKAHGDTSIVHTYSIFCKKRLVSSTKSSLIMQTAQGSILHRFHSYSFCEIFLAPGMLCSNFLCLHFADPKLEHTPQPAARGTCGPMKLSSP